MSLFVLASKDGWVHLMYTGLDAVGIDQQVSFVTLRVTNTDMSVSLLTAVKGGLRLKCLN